jgi:hypothetical protein
MRSLSEIIDAAKSNSSASEEELRYALVALEGLSVFDRTFLIRFAGDDPPSSLCCKMEATESFRRFKTALAKDPKEWLGPNNDPANPEYQRRRSIALKIFDKALAGELPTQKKPA